MPPSGHPIACRVDSASPHAAEPVRVRDLGVEHQHHEPGDGQGNSHEHGEPSGRALGLFPLRVPWLRDLGCRVAVVAGCWLWSLLVEVTARSWTWGRPRPFAALAGSLLLTAGGGAIALWTPATPTYGDTLVVSLCGNTPPTNQDRCPEPISDTDRLTLTDLIRRHGGSTREYERDAVTYVEVKASRHGDGARLADIMLRWAGVDTVESSP